MKNRDFLYVTSCCKRGVAWKTIHAEEDPDRIGSEDPGTRSSLAPYCPGCDHLNPEVIKSADPWEVARLPHPEVIERGLSGLSAVAARITIAQYLQAIANACLFNHDLAGYGSATNEPRVIYEFDLRVLASDFGLEE